MSSLKLGKVDKGAMPASKKDFLGKFHEAFSQPLQAKLSFRDEADGVWQPFTEEEGTSIHQLQDFLKSAGFMPHGKIDGIYGYATQAAVRLFQEYIRTVEGDASIGTPDGVAGPNTLSFVEKWKTTKTGTPDFVCKWAQSTSQTGSPEFNKWIGLLQQAKVAYSTKPNPILAFSEAYTKPSDTRKVKDWETSPEAIHLIGIRRNQEKSSSKRENDDVFVLLINGMVFKFWGSTDPNQTMTEGRKDEPFLIEGQHNFRFAWHKLSEPKRVYRALKPATIGVLVFRDRDNDNSLTPVDIAKGLDATPNNTINIHWSGKGDTNFSAGCQVIAGQSYYNQDDQLIDCRAFASPGYSDLQNGKTRGAYNVFTDLLLSYAPENVKTITYTLARDESFLSIEGFDENTFTVLEERMKHNDGVA